ncbi:MAG: hypothetical protein M1832_000963 [Thelocarpon impressellum]|nr:MAG: hypothetical protein M1832_000963 [Thelocarpon impressellum]
MEVSNTRLYVGNLPKDVSKPEVVEFFGSHETGEILEIKLMTGYGFIEYKDPMDARDVVPAFHGKVFKGERIRVQFAKGNRQRDSMANPERIQPRPRRTQYRMQISGLPAETSWQDLKDFARQSGCDVVYSDAGHDHDGKGFVEFETAADLKTAVEALDGRDFKEHRVTCVADVGPPAPSLRGRSHASQIQEERPRSERYRSRSPPRGGYPPRNDDYDRRPPRGMSPPRYRDRSPRRDYYDSRERYRSPPRARGPADDYPSARRGGYPDDAYDNRPRRGYEPDPYINGHARSYDRPPSPGGRRRSPGRGYHDYDRRGGYW